MPHLLHSHKTFHSTCWLNLLFAFDETACDHDQFLWLAQAFQARNYETPVSTVSSFEGMDASFSTLQLRRQRKPSLRRGHIQCDRKHWYRALFPYNSQDIFEEAYNALWEGVTDCEDAKHVNSRICWMLLRSSVSKMATDFKLLHLNILVGA